MRLRSLPALVGHGVFGGLVVAVVAFPMAAGVGALVNAAAAAARSLPAGLVIPADPQRSAVYASDGTTLITTFYDQNRHDVALGEIAPVMRQAIVAAEDTRFYEHGAIDLRGVIRALVADTGHGGAAQGASTLTMQYVRNVLKNDQALTGRQRQDATADTMQRKIQEMRYAVALERRLSKDDILEYLNIAYFGDGAYGIDAAAHTHFGKSAAELGLPEAALLAGLVQAPDADNPVTGDRAAALTRRGYVLDAMARAGDLTASQATAAAATPVQLHPSRPPDACAAVPGGHSDWGFFCDELRRWWEAQPQFGATVADRDRALRQGGYRIVTSLDPGMHAAAMRQVLAVYGYDDRLALPMAVVQPGTGRILAMAVNRHYSVAAGQGDTVNQLVAGGGGVDGYPAGSTFKMFTMLAALQAGRPLDTAFDAPARLPTRWPGSGPASCGGSWCPENASPSWMDGHRTMWTAFGRSVNTYFVWLEEQIGPERAVAMAKRLGITFRAASDARQAASPDGWGSFTLGVADTTPLDLASAYATLAAGGRYCAPLPVVSITDPEGHAVAAADPSCRQAIGADIAAAAIAADPDDPANRVGAAVSPRVDRAVATVLAEALAGQPNQAFPAPGAALAYGNR